MKAKVIKSFFWNGELIPKGQVVDLDTESKKQLVDEEGLCELSPQKEEK